MLAHTETHSLVAGVSQSYGSIVPQFDYLNVFIDFGGGVGNINVQVFIKNGLGGVDTLIASSVVGRTQFDINTTIAIPKIGIIGSTQYTLLLTSDSNFSAVKATIVGFDDQVNNQPNETVTNTLPLIQGVEVLFGTLTNYHTNVQADVDFGPNNSNLNSVWRLYGTAGLGGVRVKLFEQVISANPNNSGRKQLIINNDFFRTVGCDSFELTAQAINAIQPIDSSPTATLVGFDPNINLVTGGGSTVIVPNRREQSVNGAYVENWQSTSAILHTSVDANPAGSFVGGGIGNKSILGHFLVAPLLLSALVSVEYTFTSLYPEVGSGGNRVPYINLIVELDPVGNPGVYSIFVINDSSSPLNTGTFTPLGPNTTNCLFTVAANFTKVVLDKGMATFPIPPGPILVPVAQGPIQTVPGAWNSHAYSISAILAVYPNAQIVNAIPADGGMPGHNTIMAGILFVLGDSGTQILNAVQIFNLKLNGIAI